VYRQGGQRGWIIATGQMAIKQKHTVKVKPQGVLAATLFPVKQAMDR
jgi:hypothetical protein